jgi:hypothetical protein
MDQLLASSESASKALTCSANVRTILARPSWQPKSPTPAAADGGQPNSGSVRRHDSTPTVTPATSTDTDASSERSHPADIPRSLPFVRIRHRPRTHCDLRFLYDVVCQRMLRPAFQTGQRAATLTAEERSDRSAATGELQLMVPERQCGVRLRVNRSPRRVTLYGKTGM